MRLDLHPTEAQSKDVGFGAITYFTTKDLDASVAEGGSTRFVSFWDSEGNTLGLEHLASRALRA